MYKTSVYTLVNGNTVSVVQAISPFVIFAVFNVWVL